MMDNKYKNGLIPSVLIHLGLGGFYSLTQITNKLASEIGVSEDSIHWIFVALAITMSTSALLSSYISRKAGIRGSLTMGLVLFMSGLIVSSMSVQLKSLEFLILGYGVFSSFGIGLCYMIPIKNVMLWFPKRTGLSVGLTISSFSVSGLISSIIVSSMYENSSSLIFLLYAILGMIPIIIGLHLIKKPIFNEDRDFSNKGKLVDIITEWKFITIWLILCMKLSAGLMIFYNVIPIMNYSMTAFDSQSVYKVVILTVISCGLGKLIIPSVTDDMSKDKLKVNYIIFGAPLLALISMYLYHDWSIIPIMLIVNSFMYGAGLGCIPIILKECYGFKYIGTIQGIMFSSWCIAGIFGAKLGIYVLNSLGLNILLSLALFMYITGLILSIILIHRVKKERIL